MVAKMMIEYHTRLCISVTCILFISIRSGLTSCNLVYKRYQSCSRCLLFSKKIVSPHYWLNWWSHYWYFTVRFVGRCARIVCVRESRVTGIMSHVLIGLSVLFIEQLKLIPRPVLDGLFLYLAITALHNNQLFERIMLLVTEQVGLLQHYTWTLEPDLVDKWLPHQLSRPR